MSAMKRRPQSVSQLHDALSGAEQFIGEAGSILAGEVAVITPAEPPQKAVNAIKVKKEATASVKAQKAPVSPRIEFVEVVSDLPWVGIDDKVARPQLYSVSFPASLYAKLKFLGENEPGGPSVRKLVLDALEPYVALKLAKYEN